MTSPIERISNSAVTLAREIATPIPAKQAADDRPEGADFPATVDPQHPNPDSDPQATRFAEVDPKTPGHEGPRGQLPAIPGYEVLEELGRGGMGVVYRARQLAFDRPVALKVLLEGGCASTETLIRFQNEAQAIARLHHPNIVQVHDAGMHEGRPYLVMEYIAGGNLARRLQGKPQTAEESARLLAVLARAVQAAHVQQVVHRDLTPANILLCDPSLGPRLTDAMPKITDFGLARHLDRESRFTQTGQVLGTPAYVAPEQAAGKSGTNGILVDVYGLGAILYEMLTGRPPFTGITVLDTLAQVMSPEEVVPPRRLLASIPADLETICLKCLSKEPARRYASAAALADDLDRFLRHQPILARPVSRIERASKWVRRHPAVSALSALLLLVTILGIGGIVWKWQQEARARRDAEQARTAEIQAHEATADALRKVTSAREDAERRRIESDRWRMDYGLEKHLSQCERGQADRGVLGLTRDLLFGCTALPNESADLQRVVRWNLALWSQTLPTLKHVYPEEGDATLGGLTPEGNFFWTREPENGVRLWDVDSGNPRSPVLKHNQPVTHLAVSADGRVIVTAAGNIVRSWTAESGNPLGPALEHPAELVSLALTRDGRRILSGSADRLLRLWNVNEPKPLGEPIALPGAIQQVMFSPDGRRAVAWDDQKSARLLDGISGTPVGEVLPLTRVSCAAFSGDSKTLALGGGNLPSVGFVHLYSTENASAAGPPMRHAGLVNSVAFSPDGRIVASASSDSTVRLWDAATGSSLKEPLRHKSVVLAVAFGPQGRSLATASFSPEDGRGGVIQLWDADSLSPIGLPLGHPKSSTTLVFRSAGNSLCAAGRDGFVRLWQLCSWRRTGLPVTHTREVMHLAFTDGNTALTAGAEGLWKLTSPRTHQGGRCLEGMIPLAVAPDGRMGVMGSPRDRRPARRWDVSGNRLLGNLAPLSPGIPCVAFSADGKKLITNTADGAARLWDAATGQPLGEPMRHGAEVLAVALSPDEKTVLTTGPDGVGRLWEAATGQPTGTAFENAGLVAFAVILPDGRGFLTTDFKGVARMWDAAGQPVTLPGGSAKVVAISPDGNLVVTEDAERTVRLWDVPTGRAVGPSLFLDLPAARKLPAASPYEFWPHWYFSPDGRGLATRRDNNAWLWPIPPLAQGEAADLRDRMELLTGLRLRADDTLETLDAASWHAHRLKVGQR